MGEPSHEVKQRIASQLERHFPNPDRLLSRDLAALLVYLESPTVVAKIVPLLAVPEEPEDQDIVDEALVSRNTRYGPTVAGINKTRPARQQFAYATVLRSARVGWTPELRERYFAWFNRAYNWTGGLSFNGFINNIRMIALAAVSDPAERARLAQLSQRPEPTLLAGWTAAKGPGKDYTLDGAVAAVRGQLTGRNFNQGRTMYASAACIACHRLGTLGMGTAAPILTQAGSRYSERDLLQSIIEPSASINENYAATRYEMKDGSVLVGYPAFEEGGELFITSNLMLPNSLTLVKSGDVKSSRRSETSLMPTGLINALNEDELRDLVAFILSGGDPSNRMFVQPK
jgi:putative heme-binding domain-containing protein